MQTAFRHFQIAHQRVGQAVILDAVENGAGGRIFFTAGSDVDGLVPAAGTIFDNMHTVGDGLIVDAVGVDTPTVEIDGEHCDIALSPRRLELLEGLNVGLAIRNGQSVEITLDWLRWHVEHHGMNAALIVDRAEMGSNRAYTRALKKGIALIAGLKQIVVVQYDVPLGDPELPAEQHPFCAPDAPGKDRMDIPSPDPMKSPLGQLGLFELLRHRFLDKARAVAQLDLTDLLEQTEEGSVFDRAVQARNGVITLIGSHCYPWRVRDDDTCHFADHICRQFDAGKPRQRWCIAPSVAGEKAVWRYVRIAGVSPSHKEQATFLRYMGLRHPVESVSKIVPKTSLIEDDGLLNMAANHWSHKPVRMPVMKSPKVNKNKNSVTIITTMKNEGPFILEWIAYHRAIGVDNFLVFTNDCTDGTDDFHELLQAKGILQHRDNPFHDTGLKPQHAALQAGEKEDIIKNADWVICMDVDEFINVKTGDGTLKALFKAVPKANMISMTWRLFGNSDIHEFTDQPIIGDYTRCAHEMTRKPHQAWGFKTLFRNIGLFKKLGVHRPKGLNPQLWEQINWVNGSGKAMPKEFFRNAWRSTQETVGYDLVCLNHYAVRSAESFLVKRDRGRVNHVDRDQGLAYWFRMNHNVGEDTSIQRMLPALQVEMDKLLADPEIKAMHERCVAAHREKIDALKATDNYAKFYQDLTGERMERLSKLLPHFGANVFLAGPDVVPDEVALEDHPEDYFFTVERQDTTAH
ncbi:glycosyltransferase family 2 protein [Cognatishimia sp. 1_MG-2023]|uniref:glycosyltransferase family 2 protein n=1 Tax=Cognatishimia sp. 1_MG-2023 TaxID=3062642 RepID=UPI0026E1DAF4|nr:glycosyltransferase family 2 protein [Cognatishimia sp. 1_MG-2023]MDO6727176.1 glycosyltransferase family 2 protein [Cognatishimia sp. 1_MG-2023]